MNKLNNASLQKHIQMIYDCTIMENSWEHLLATLANDLGCRSGSMAVESRRDDAHRIHFRVAHGYPEDEHKMIRDYVYKIDNWTLSLWTLNSGRFEVSERLYPHRRLVKTEFYNDFCKVFGMRNSTGCILRTKSDHIMKIAFQNSSRKSDGFREQTEYLNQLRPHIVRASLIQQRMVEQQLSASLLSTVVDSVPAAAFLLEEDCTIRYQNTAAEELLGSSRLVKTHGNRIKLGHTNARDFYTAVKAAIAVAQGEDIKSYNETLLLYGSDKTGDTQVLIQPLSTSEPSFSLHYRKVLVLVYFQQVSDNWATNNEALRKIFGLTPRELALAAALIDGHPLQEIARKQRKSMNTLKTQLSSLFAKTDTHSQQQLISRLTSSLARLRQISR